MDYSKIYANSRARDITNHPRKLADPISPASPKIRTLQNISLKHPSKKSIQQQSSSSRGPSQAIDKSRASKTRCQGTLKAALERHKIGKDAQAKDTGPDRSWDASSTASGVDSTALSDRISIAKESGGLSTSVVKPIPPQPSFATTSSEVLALKSYPRSYAAAVERELSLNCVHDLQSLVEQQDEPNSTYYCSPLSTPESTHTQL